MFQHRHLSAPGGIPTLSEQDRGRVVPGEHIWESAVTNSVTAQGQELNNLNKLRGGVGNVLQELSLAQEWNSAPGNLHHMRIPCFIYHSSSIHRKNILHRYATTVFKEGRWAWDKEQHTVLVQGTGKCWMYIPWLTWDLCLQASSTQWVCAAKCFVLIH